LPATVVGVMPGGMEFPQFSQMWFPLGPVSEPDPRNARRIQLFRTSCGWLNARGGTCRARSARKSHGRRVSRYESRDPADCKDASPRHWLAVVCALCRNDRSCGIRAPHCLRQCREPSLGTFGTACPRDGASALPWGKPLASRAPDAHREPAPERPGGSCCSRPRRDQSSRLQVRHQRCRLAAVLDGVFSGQADVRIFCRCVDWHGHSGWSGACSEGFAGKFNACTERGRSFSNIERVAPADAGARDRPAGPYLDPVDRRRGDDAANR
jgi:hypothetical protein